MYQAETYQTPNPDQEWSITNPTCGQLAPADPDQPGEADGQGGGVAELQDGGPHQHGQLYLLRLEMWPSMTDQKQVLMVDDHHQSTRLF